MKSMKTEHLIFSPQQVLAFYLNEDSVAVSSAPSDRRYIVAQILSRLGPVSSQSLDCPITQEEVLQAIRSMPRRWIPGPDGLPLDFFSIFSDLLAPVLTKVFNLF
jgi:hypothetical protein